jgi:hypothetical protein
MLNGVTTPKITIHILTAIKMSYLLGLPRALVTLNFFFFTSQSIYLFNDAVMLVEWGTTVWLWMSNCQEVNDTTVAYFKAWITEENH